MLFDEFSKFSRHIPLWLRYTDDVFLLWDVPLELINECLSAMKYNDYNLTFTMSFNRKKVTFLDVTVEIAPDGMLTSDLYRKPSAGNTILRADSFQAQPLLQSILYSQYLRHRHNCSDDTKIKRATNEVKSRLFKRGYSKSCIRRAFKQSCTGVLIKN